MSMQCLLAWHLPAMARRKFSEYANPILEGDLNVK